MNEEEAKQALLELWEKNPEGKGKFLYIDYHMNQIRRKNKGYFVEQDAKEYIENLKNVR